MNEVSAKSKNVAAHPTSRTTLRPTLRPTIRTTLRTTLRATLRPTLRDKKPYEQKKVYSLYIRTSP